MKTLPLPSAPLPVRPSTRAVVDTRDVSDTEYRSLDAFVSSVIEDDRTTFDALDLQHLNFRLRVSIPVLRRELESYGLSLAVREIPVYKRGINSPQHDRWYGKGSSPMMGGAAYDGMMLATYGAAGGLGGMHSDRPVVVATKRK